MARITLRQLLDHAGERSYGVEFGAAGNASKIKKVIPLAEMAKRYASGELDPKFA